MRQWSRYFDWLLALEPEEEADGLRQVRAFEKENDMPYVTRFERLGRAEGRAEGEKAGLEKGLVEGLCQTIATILEVRFGVDPATVTPLVGKDKSGEELKGLVETAKKAPSMEAFHAVLDAGKTEF